MNRRVGRVRAVPVRLARATSVASVLAALNTRWFRQPATGWSRVLPVGSGRLGVKIHDGASAIEQFHALLTRSSLSNLFSLCGRG